ncbi:LisH domain and HEAT repeat-containing protein KIAA1468-like protein [Auxenochlorella protothecoides]|uniref:LisH domain and HEAT repeat-containing protein KIAA1468-like protein n=1 Tax=Auxenochlorella protothecoides TaxID=3075 RepID=A0A087SG90_AUXPR|nr:LisH domain and HEAT repeat-containing protein KIAA1468-like protein [Auxenochlorella protothecoides]KFM24744.1 LisH domain and HEAT repeat-containing protein KIAA1468-like protein [Auxenochlorella protothecoides]
MLYIPQTISGGGGLKVWDVVVQGTGGAVGGLQALGTTKLVIAEIGGAGHVATPRPGAYQMVDVVQKVSQWLLQRNYLLTALELLMEAGEAGREAEVETLEHLFSDPTLFPPEQMAVFTGREALDLQATARAREERLAVPRSPRLDPTQRRVLNDIVMRYLLDQGYRVTAGTLRAEAGSGVPPLQTAAPGTLAPEPPALAACHDAVAQLADARAELAATADALGTARVQLADVREAEAEAQRRLESAAEEGHRLQAALDFEASRVRDLEERLAQKGGNGAGDEEAGDGWGKGQRGSSPAALSAAAARSALDEVAASLPALLPHVLINRRQEAVPLLLALAREHPQLETRSAMAACLFNLIKKPSAEQREMLVGACVRLASAVSPTRVQLELLPALCSGADADALERRLLVAEAAAALAPLFPRAALAGAALGLADHLAHDAEAVVRLAALRALCALLRARVAPGAAGRLRDLALHLVLDPGAEVAAAAQDELVPALADWAAGGDTGSKNGGGVLLDLAAPALEALGAGLARAPFLAGTPEESVAAGSAVLRAPSGAVVWRAMALLQMLLGLLPAVQRLAAATIPPWAGRAQRDGEERDGAASGDGHASGPVLAAALEAWCASSGAGAAHEWPAVDCLVLTIVPAVVGAARLVAPVPETKGLRQRFAAVLKTVCLGLGEAASAAAVEPLVYTAGHPHATAKAVRFACAEALSVQNAVLETLAEGVGSGSAEGCVCMALLAGAVAPTLPGRQAQRRLIPLLVALMSTRPRAAQGEAARSVSQQDDEEWEEGNPDPSPPPAVLLAAMSAAAEVLAAFPEDAAVQTELAAELDRAAGRGGERTELALLHGVARLVASATLRQLEWVLQRVLLLLATIHQRASCGRTQEQLRAAARVAFAVLYQVDLSRLEPGSRVALHLAAALGALQREADLLDPGQRDVLAAVMADAGVEGTASPAAVPGLGPRLPVPTLAPDPEGVEALARTLFVPGKVFQDWRWDDILEA